MDDPTAREDGMLRAVLDALPEAVMVHDTTTVLYVNRSALDFLHATREDQVVGAEYMRFVHEDARSAGAERQSLLRESGHPLPTVPLKLVAVDGAIVHAEARAWRIGFDGRTATLVVARLSRG